MNLMIKDFPDELRFKLRLKAFEGGVTFRELVVMVLAGWAEEEVVPAEPVVRVGRKREGKEVASSPVREIPVIRDEHINRLSKQAPAKPESPPAAPEVANPWEVAYDKIRDGRKKKP